MISNEYKVIVNLTIVYSYSHNIGNFNIETNLINGKNISLNDLINELINKIDFQRKIISYYDKDLKLFIYCGKFPLEKEFLFEYKKDEIVQIKLRQITNKIFSIKSELLEDENETDDNNTNNIFISSKSKRAKERKIGEIIKKVYMWRKLYIGYINENGKLIKLSLEDSADKIGISKKSLDDYLIQLRIGKLFGFNFTEHKNDKVGVLRAFVKKHKAEYEQKKLHLKENPFNININSILK